MKVFMAYHSLEEADAEDLADYLTTVFAQEGIELFRASSWESIAPGDAWQGKAIDELCAAEALLVLMSHETLTRHWINFEMGIAWATKTRIVIFCHKGLTPELLPRPYSDLQAVDLNGLTHQRALERAAEAVANALAIRLPMPGEATEVPAAVAAAEVISEGPPTFASINRAWSLRPASHVGETAVGRFLIGTVYPARPDRAKAANLKSGETLNVRLFKGPKPEGAYINAMVAGDTASYFEHVVRDVVQVDAEISLAGYYEDELGVIPLYVIDGYTEIPGQAT